MNTHTTHPTNTSTPDPSAPDVVTWGPVDDSDVRTLHFPPPSTDWVSVKRYLTEADDSAASDAAMAEGMQYMSRGDKRKAQRGKARAGTDLRMFYKQGTYRLTILQRLIKSWSFVNADTGRPIPVTADTVARLPVHTRDFIMEYIDEVNPRADEEDDEWEDNPDAESELSADEEEARESGHGPLVEPTGNF